MKIYLVRQHLQVGDESILGVALNETFAKRVAERYNEKTGTKNFDVIEMVSGEFPDPSAVFSN